jgi:hypothetical protein
MIERGASRRDRRKVTSLHDPLLDGKDAVHVVLKSTQSSRERVRKNCLLERASLSQNTSAIQ